MAAREAAHTAMNYQAGESFEPVEEAAKSASLRGPGVAVSGSSNFGADSFLFARTRKLQELGDDHEMDQPEELDIILQSKRTVGNDTQTLDYALAQAKKDLDNHGIKADITGHGAPWVQGDPLEIMLTNCGFLVERMPEFGYTPCTVASTAHHRPSVGIIRSVSWAYVKELI